MSLLIRDLASSITVPLFPTNIRYFTMRIPARIFHEWSAATAKLGTRLRD
jgi:hypothetical protein